MQDFGFRASAAIDEGRAEIKSRLLSSAPLASQSKPAPQEPHDPEPQAGKLPLPKGTQSEFIDVAAGGPKAAEERPGTVKWIEPVLVEPVPGYGSAEPDFRTEMRVEEGQAPGLVPAPGAVVAVASGTAHLGQPKTPGAPPRLAMFRWRRRPSASPVSAPGAAIPSKEIGRERDVLADEVAALRRTLAAERTAAADEIAALRLTLAAEREAAADEIAALRKILTAERDAAADEIAVLRTILAAQQEAAAARANRLKTVLGAPPSSGTPSG